MNRTACNVDPLVAHPATHFTLQIHLAVGKFKRKFYFFFKERTKIKNFGLFIYFYTIGFLGNLFLRYIQLFCKASCNLVFIFRCKKFKIITNNILQLRKLRTKYILVIIVQDITQYCSKLQFCKAFVSSVVDQDNSSSKSFYKIKEKRKLN